MALLWLIFSLGFDKSKLLNCNDEHFINGSFIPYTVQELTMEGFCNLIKQLNVAVHVLVPGSGQSTGAGNNNHQTYLLAV